MSDAIRRIDPEELRTHVARLRALARRLLADGGQADDIVQDALVVAIERPPHTGVAMGPWLVGVVRHLVHRQYRSSSRRATYESAVVSREGTPTPDEIAARSEALRDLADAVHRLEPIYRDVVVLHFFDDLRTSEIAAQLGVPVETVRTRLKRALAQLRATLDAEHGGDGRSWCAALLPLAARQSLTAKSGIVAGGIVVTTKTKLSIACAALLLLALSSYVAFVGGGARGPADSGSDLAIAAADATVKPRDHRSAASKPAEATAAPLPAGTAAIVGTVCMGDSPKPVRGQKVVLLTSGAAAETTTDDRGSFRFDHLSEECSWRVEVAADGFAKVVVPNLRLERDETRDLGTLRLVASARFDVVVRDWGDHAISGAQVEIQPSYADGVMIDVWTTAAPYRASAEPVASAITDAAGRATIDSLPPRRWFVVARAAGFITGSAYIGGDTGRSEVTLRLDRGARLDGVVLDRDRRPVADATVFAAFGDRYAGVYTFPRAPTDAAGRFALTDVVPGDVTLLVARKGSLPAVAATVRVPGAFPVEIVLDGSIVEGRVTSAADGSPIAGARVMADLIPKAGDNWVVETTTSDDGTYRLDTMHAGDVWHFRVERQGFAAIAESGRKPEGSLVIEGGHATRDFVMGPGVGVSGRVTGPSGPMAGVRVVANWVVAQTLLKVEGWTDVEGKFALSHVAEGTVLLEARAPGFVQDGLPPYAVMSFWAGQKPPRWIYEVSATGLHGVEVVMTAVTKPNAEPASAMPTVRVAGRVSSPGGGAPAGSSVQIVIPPSGESRWETETLAARVPVLDDGRYEATFVPRGSKFRVRGSAPGFSSRDLPAFEFAPGRTSFDVDVALTPLFTLEGRLVSSEDDSVTVAGARLSLLPASWKFDQSDRRAMPVAAVSGADGRFRIEGVASGDAKLDVTCDGFVHDVLALPAVPGADVTLRVEPAKEIAGTVRLAGGGPLANLTLTFRRENDSRMDNFWWARSGDDGRFRVTGLRSGTYEVATAAGRDTTTSLRYTTLTGVSAGKTDLEIVVESAGEIAGRVLGPDGKPMAGVGIGTWSETGDRYTPSAVSQEDGSFVIRGLANCTYRLDARPPDSLRNNGSPRYPTGVLGARLTGVAPGTRDVEIRMPAANVIRGVVVTSTGAPLANAVVRADLLPGQKSDPWAELAEHVSSVPTDADGRFVITGLAALHYRLVHVPDPFDTRVLRPLRGGEDIVAGATDVRLVSGGIAKITGVVVDEEGNVVAEAGVGARPAGGGPGVFSKTLADGSFSLDGVSDLVTYVVSAAKGDVLRGETAGVAPGASGVRVCLLRGLEASGRVLQKDGTPFANAYVELALEGSDFRKSAKTDADGRFAAKGLRPGVYRVAEMLMVIRPGDSGKPRACGTISAGDKDVELRMTE